MSSSRVSLNSYLLSNIKLLKSILGSTLLVRAARKSLAQDPPEFISEGREQRAPDL
jgi:hypothetical protein